MAKLAIITNRQTLLDQAAQLIHNFHFDDVLYMTAHGQNVEGCIQKAVKNHIDIIISRGMQAILIQKLTDIPVVDLYITNQEIGMLIGQAKAMLHKERPMIALVGLYNTYSDTSSLNALYDIDFRVYCTHDAVDLQEEARKAIQDGADFILGGDMAGKIAREQGVPSLFVTSGEESFHEALRVAEKVGAAIDVQKKNTAELRTLLEYSFGGLVKLDANGYPVVMNHIAEKLLMRTHTEISHLHISQVFCEITRDMLARVLNGEEIYSRVVRYKKKTMLVNMAPVRIGDVTDGVILSLQEGEQITRMEHAIRRTASSHGYRARFQFSDFKDMSPRAKRLVQLATTHSQSDVPVLISGEAGTEKELFAQAIHNDSLRKSEPFLAINCQSIAKEQQEALLFGTGHKEECGYLEMAHGGTLLLENISCLNLPVQSRLCDYLQGRSILPADFQAFRVNVRIIATEIHPQQKVEQGVLCAELFHTLNSLSLEVPPLRQRPQDIIFWTKHYVEEISALHSRYLTLSKDAMDKICQHNWSGNLVQLRSFCQRIAVMAPKRIVSGSFIAEQLLEAYPVIAGDGKRATLRTEEAVRIANLLQQYEGDRSKVASAMGISKTTLWRKMNQHGIVHKYTISSAEPLETPCGGGD